MENLEDSILEAHAKELPDFFIIEVDFHSVRAYRIIKYIKLLHNKWKSKGKTEIVSRKEFLALYNHGASFWVKNIFKNKEIFNTNMINGFITIEEIDSKQDNLGELPQINWIKFDLV